MKFAMTATDRYFGVWEAFLAAGWEPLKLFTTPVDGRIHQHQQVVDAALARKIPVQLSPLSEHDLAELKEQGCEALVVASYAWRIGDWRRHLHYAVNFHPSPLPVGRGPDPLVPAILGVHSEWGVSCHQIEPEWDRGAILAQRRFPLSAEECHESLDFKVQIATRHLANEVASRFVDYWERATPQGAGSYFGRPSLADRLLDWSLPVADLLRRVRAFGPMECIARLGESTLYVRRALGWQETHQYAAGTVVHTSNLRVLIAVPDGFIGLVEWSLNPPDVRLGAGAR